MNNLSLVENRLQNMQKVYSTLEQFIDELPSIIPEKTRQSIKDSILGDDQLKELMADAEKQRTPRLFLFGRTGCGKSSIINALCGAYVTEVSDTESCTKETRTFTCQKNGRILLDVMDSRGVAESEDSQHEIEEKLIQDILEYDPDIMVLVMNCSHRDSMDSDINLAIRLKKAYYNKMLLEIPVIIVLNKADTVPPVREIDPDLYSQRKNHSISQITGQVYSLQNSLNLNACGVLAVSSVMEWEDDNGTTLSAEEINQLSSEERQMLNISFDGRWHYSELLHLIESSMTDADARSGLRMALKLEDMITDLAKHLVDVFSGIAGTIALTPIPVADLYVLLALQSVMVAIIAILSGREANIESAKEFILSLGGVGGAGLGFRLLAQQSSKLLNGLFPGAGSVISTAVAASGTKAIGNAAIAYYLK